MPDLVVAGAGMAGLVAATRAAELGARVLVHEKGDVPGGSMRHASGFVWRYRDLRTAQAQCPGADPALLALVVDELDGALEWLEGVGVPILERSTGNELTVGWRVDVLELTRVLARGLDDLRLSDGLVALPAGVPVILATGGFQGSRALLREHVTSEADHVGLRANPWSTGDGLLLGVGAGAALSDGLGELYGRAMPDVASPPDPRDWVALAQLYAGIAEVVSSTGERFPRGSVSWHESDVVAWMARQPRARATFRVPRRSLHLRVRERTVAELVEAARRAGAAVRERPGVVEVPVVASITSTLGGLRVDASGRVVGCGGAPIEGLFAAGGDAGGFATGGYASGSRRHLVAGRAAAAAALGLA